jgi:hypothetical protein
LRYPQEIMWILALPLLFAPLHLEAFAASAPKAAVVRPARHRTQKVRKYKARRVRNHRTRQGPNAKASARTRVKPPRRAR